MPRSNALKEAQRRWRQNNPRVVDISRKRSAAKSYIINHATLDEMYKFFAFFSDAHPEFDCASALKEIQNIQKK